MNAKRTYLDYNATAPLRRPAREAMLAAIDAFGNPSSVHAEGRRAHSIIEEAREKVAALVNAKPSEVVFTSGATEANNWVTSAGWDAIYRAGVEHDSVLAPAEASGAANLALDVNSEGEIVPRAMESSGARTLLAIQLANNETGVVQPVAEAAAMARRSGLTVHCDAVQAPGRIPVDFRALGVDTMSLSAHKLGGPKGIGALVVREGLELEPFIRGGGQERRRRGGTENTAAIAGFGAAAEAARADLDHAVRLEMLRAVLEREAMAIAPSLRIIGAGARHRLPNTSCLALPGLQAETVVINLDLAGVAVSAGAACSSGKVGPSRALAAIGLPSDVLKSAIRVSFGPETSEAEIAHFLAAWGPIATQRKDQRMVA